MSKELKPTRPTEKSWDKIKIIAVKEFSDDITSKRLWILLAVLLLFFIGGIATIPSLLTVTVNGEEIRLPRLAQIFLGGISSLNYIVPLMGLAIGYDAISRERETGTLRILLSRPIYRDYVINGKVLSAIATLGITLFISVFLTVSIAIVTAGVTPSIDDFLRLFLFSLFTVMYALGYYSIALLFSTLFSKSNRSLAVSIVIWIFFSLIMQMIASFIALSRVGFPTGWSEEVQREWLEKLGKEIAEIAPYTVGLTLNFHYQTLASSVLSKSTEQETLDVLKVFGQTLGSLIVMILVPIILIMISYIIFVRREEK
ncbi:MAG: ABC transporter permease [Thermoproteota archaeon]|nr:ABC transporter permease [Candidatus Brockarchaeota archaeon]